MKCADHGLSLEGDSKIAQGTVKWFNPDKGFGFIAPDDGTADIFVHHSAIDMSGYRTLTENQKVAVRRQPGSQGPAGGTGPRSLIAVVAAGPPLQRAGPPHV